MIERVELLLSHLPPPQLCTVPVKLDGNHVFVPNVYSAVKYPPSVTTHDDRTVITRDNRREMVLPLCPVLFGPTRTALSQHKLVLQCLHAVVQALEQKMIRTLGANEYLEVFESLSA